MTIETAYDRAAELVHEIDAQIVSEQVGQDDRWDSLAVAAILAGGSVQISGYAYEDCGKPRPARVGSGPLADQFETLCKAMQNPTLRAGRWRWCRSAARAARSPSTTTMPIRIAGR